MADAITVEEMLQAEKSAINQGWDEARLLETAGRALGRTIHHLHPRPGTVIATFGCRVMWRFFQLSRAEEISSDRSCTT